MLEESIDSFFLASGICFAATNVAPGSGLMRPFPEQIRLVCIERVAF